jgi:hypothetical protein
VVVLHYLRIKGLLEIARAVLTLLEKREVSFAYLTFSHQLFYMTGSIQSMSHTDMFEV